MSLPPLIQAGFTYTPELGKGPLKVDFSDGAAGYDAIEETGSATAEIHESGSETDTITER